MLAAVGSTGCIEALKIADASLRLTGAIIDIAASGNGGSNGSQGSNACCYSRENPTPVEGAVDRPMSACELARGRWREANQDQDEVPAELHCLGDGSYPKVFAPASPGPSLATPVDTQEESPPASQAAAPADAI